MPKTFHRLLANLVRRRRLEADLDEELRSWIAEMTERKIRQGTPPDEARRQALAESGGLEQVREEVRANWLGSGIETAMRETRYAVRALFRNLGFSLTTVGTLALGIGATTAVFSVLHGVLLKPLPYPAADRLVTIYDSYQQQGEDRGPAGIADFLDWKRLAHSFHSLDAWANESFTLTGNADAEKIPGLEVTAGFFDTLGVHPILGRTFSSGEDQPGRPATVLISERLWRRRFASDPGIVRRSIPLSGRFLTVIGVISSNFRFAGENDVWSILTLDPPTRRGPFFLGSIARLRSGVTVEQAASEMASIARVVETDHPQDYTHLRFPTLSLNDSIVGDIRPLLWILTAAVSFVLLISVTNVANLMLARATARRREIAIRLSIGAGRIQLVRQLMAESLVLSLAGSGIGLLLAYGVISGLRWSRPQGLPRLTDIQIDWAVLFFTLIVSMAAALLFGLGPAMAASRASVSTGLNSGARGTHGVEHGRIRAALVIGQVGLSVLLLIGAGLLIRSFTLLGSVGLGFHAPPDHILLMQVSPSGSRYQAPPPVDGKQPINHVLINFWNELLSRVRALPGVESASLSITIPPSRVAFTDGYEIAGRPPAPGAEPPAVVVPFVSHDYLRTLGIQLRLGRWFDRRDGPETPRVTVLSEAMARREFPGENPVGQRMYHGNHNVNEPMEIIGVVADVRYEGLDRPGSPAFYELSDQVPFRPMWLLVRTTQRAQTLTNSVRSQIRSLDPTVPVDRIGTMAGALSESVSLPRFRLFMMTAFAATALLLAAIGIYGTIAYGVAQRRQEIGIRIALGATPSGVIGQIVGQGARLTIVGVALGLAAAFGLTRFLEKMLFGVTSADATTFTSAPVLLAAVALTASLVPALRAARIDPARTLRQE